MRLPKIEAPKFFFTEPHRATNLSEANVQRVEVTVLGDKFPDMMRVAFERRQAALQGKPDPHPEKKLYLVLTGGAMQGAFTAGILTALKAQHLHLEKGTIPNEDTSGEPSLLDMFDGIIGVSTGAACAYYASSKKLDSAEIYYSDIPNAHTINYTTPWEILSLNKLAQILKAREVDPDEFHAFHPKVIIGTTKDGTLESDFIDLKNTDNPIDYIIESCRIPRAARGHRNQLEGFYRLDGGVGDPWPTDQAAAEHATDVLVITTTEPGLPADILPQVLMPLGLVGMRRELRAKISAMSKETEKGFNQVVNTQERPEALREANMAVMHPAHMTISGIEINPFAIRSVFYAAFDQTRALLKKIEADMRLSKHSENQGMAS